MAECKPERGYRCDVFRGGVSIYRVDEIDGESDAILLTIREAEHLLANLPAVIQDAKDGGPYEDEDSEEDDTAEAAICDRNKAMQQILRWCDRQGEEPEGQCLHEIEQICRKQLGLELLVVSRELTPAEHTEERIKNATEGAVDAYDE